MALGFLFTGALLAPYGMAQEKISFSINGATSGPNYKDLACTTTANQLNISGTYTVTDGKKITIGPNQSGTAYITCDEANDILILKNAKISSVDAAGKVVRIAFWRKYSGTAGSADYSVSADGSFGGNPNLSALALRGYVEKDSSFAVLGALPDPPVTSPFDCYMQLTRCATTNPASWAFTSTAFSVTWNVPLNATRILKAQFWFKLAANTHTLSFSPGKGIQVKLGPPPGPPDETGSTTITPPTCPEGQQCRGECPDCLLPKWCLWVILGLAVVVFIFAVAYYKKSK